RRSRPRRPGDPCAAAARDGARRRREAAPCLSADQARGAGCLPRGERQRLEGQAGAPRGGAPAPPMTEAAVRCEKLVKRYGEVTAVDGLDLEVRRGECFGLLGPNGAGKTTTVEILEGLNDPTAGTVEVLGMRWTRDDKALRQRLGISLQETHLPEKLTVEENLRLFRSFYQRGREIDEVLDLVELRDKRRSWTEKLSGGPKRRLSCSPRICPRSPASAAPGGAPMESPHRRAPPHRAPCDSAAGARGDASLHSPCQPRGRVRPSHWTPPARMNAPLTDRSRPNSL